MRLKLILSCKKGALIALNNRYELNAVLYKILERADSEFSHWLHDKGYAADGRNFKLFTFGWLDAYPFEFKKEQNAILAKEGKATWELSFCVDKIIENFVAGLFHEASFELKAGFLEKVHFRIENVEILPPPTFFETMHYSCVTPILMGRKAEGAKHETYLSPLDEGYESLFLHNLRGKVKAVQGDTFVDAEDVSFRLLSLAEKVKRKGFDVNKGKEKIRCIPFAYDFELIAPAEWQRIGYLSGFGNDSSFGLGMCKILK